MHLYGYTNMAFNSIVNRPKVSSKKIWQDVEIWHAGKVKRIY